jgi:hypothetical protein
MDLVLYRAVGAQNRIALGDLVTAEFYAATADPDGTIHLKPVNIIGATKRTDTSDIAGGVYPIPGADGE